MNMLIDLYNEASEFQITVDCFHLPGTHSLSVMDECGACHIGMDPFSMESGVDELQFLAHEMGHCRTGSFYNRYSDCDSIHRHEARARQWAIRRLMPIHLVEEAISNGITEVWELSSYFSVSPDFAAEAVSFYKDIDLLH